MDQKITNIEIKQKNRTSIFSLFRHHEQLSRQDIVTALDLSLPTVTNNLEELKAEIHRNAEQTREILNGQAGKSHGRYQSGFIKERI